MAITKNAAGGMSKFITEPGEYAVEVSNVQFGKSKKGDAMVTVVFETDDNQSIKSFFVPKHAFMLDNLNKLKISCGEKPETSTDKLIGKRCGILVEKGKVDAEGRSFPQVVGFGPDSDVIPSAFKPEETSDDDVIAF